MKNITNKDLEVMILTSTLTLFISAAAAKSLLAILVNIIM